MFYSLHVVPKLNSNDPAVGIVVNAIARAAELVGIPVVDRKDIQPSTLIVAVGGDGTMLEALRLAARHDATALGANMGNVGFLTEVSVAFRHRDSVEMLFVSILKGDVDTFVDERTVLTTSHSEQLACNEVSVSQMYSDSMITYHLRVGQMNAGIHRANSLLVSTATGSTAYSLSAGGALMMPNINALQIVPVAPITMTSRPIIVGTDTKVIVDVWGKGVAVRNDGQIAFSSDHEYTKDNPFSIEIRPYITKAKMLHLAGWNYFKILTEKLGWISR